MKQKARLENWCFVAGTLYGEIYDDEAGRFEDGDSVSTSSVLPMSMQTHTPAEGYEIATRNTIYLLGKPYKGEV